MNNGTVVAGMNSGPGYTRWHAHMAGLMGVTAHTALGITGKTASGNLCKIHLTVADLIRATLLTTLTACAYGRAAGRHCAHRAWDYRRDGKQPISARCICMRLLDNLGPLSICR